METTRLLNNEKRVKDINLQVGFKQAISSLEWSKWTDAKITFTNKRILLNTESESTIYSYESMSGIQIMEGKLPAKINKILFIVITFFLLFIIGIVAELTILVGIAIAFVFLSAFIYFAFMNIKTYHICFISQTSSVLAEFDIVKDTELKHLLLDAFELGKQENKV